MLFGQNLKGGTPFWVLFKDAGIVYESFRNELSNLEFLFSQNESTKRIFQKQVYESNPRNESCYSKQSLLFEIISFYLCSSTIFAFPRIEGPPI